MAEGTQIAKAYVQIIPSAKGIKNSLKSIMDSEAQSAGKSSGGIFSNAFSGVVSSAAGFVKTAAGITTAAVGAATTGVVALTKEAVGNFGEYEQLVGGVETLFKDSANTVQKYAKDAYKNQGMSANEYMTTVTSFSASLLQSLDGDTQAAAQKADLAITDMSDNANKMGSSMESIQNAYQGFAKQNYTMLDNLKLGYGGTKEEMQRLLDDASKLSGIQYDISSYGDIVDAIHVVQNEMGITGTTAKEASSTIEGSLGAVKASWTNLITGLGDKNANLGELTGQLVESVGIAFQNILPVAEQALTGITQIISEMIPAAINEIPTLINNVLPQLLDSGKNITQSLLDGIQQNLPTIISGGMQILSMLTDTIISMLPQIIEMGMEILLQLAVGIAQALPDLIPTIVDVIITITETLIDNIDLLIDASIQIILALAEGLINALPRLIEKAPVIIDKLITAFVNNAPKLITSAAKLIIELAGGLIKNIPLLIKAIPQIITSLVNGLIEGSVAIVSVGADIVTGLWNGIGDKLSWLKDKLSGFCKNALGAIKSFFGIESPSKVFRDEVGKWIPEGMAVGIDANADAVYDSMQELKANTLDIGDVRGSFNYEYSSKSSDNGLERVLELLNEYLPAIGNQQLVLDTGALVGGTVSQFDTELGKLQISKGRGR